MGGASAPSLYRFTRSLSQPTSTHSAAVTKRMVARPGSGRHQDARVVFRVPCAPIHATGAWRGISRPFMLATRRQQSVGRPIGLALFYGKECTSGVKQHKSVDP